MFGVDIVDDDGEMAVAVAERVSLLAIEIDGQFDLEGRGGMAQIDQREIGKFQVIGDFEPERARVEIERSGLVENADHGVDGLCHSVQLLQISDDGCANLGLCLPMMLNSDGPCRTGSERLSVWQVAHCCLNSAAPSGGFGMGSGICAAAVV